MSDNRYQVFEVKSGYSNVRSFVGTLKQCQKFVDKKLEEFPDREYLIDKVVHRKLKL